MLSNDQIQLMTFAELQIHIKNYEKELIRLEREANNRASLVEGMDIHLQEESESKDIILNQKLAHYAKVSQEIYQRYHEAFDGDVQGACIIIADEISRAINGTPVAGFLCMCGIERSHWWIEKDGITIDPMGDRYKDEINFHRKEAHRSLTEFNTLLPRYEKYRLL